MMETCDHSLHIWIETVDHLETGTGEHKETPEAESSSPVYGSCEEAAEAGEEREQGRRKRVPGGNGPERPGRRRGWGSM